jgi:hypothetical protein
MKLQKTVLGAVVVAVVSGWASAKPVSAGVPNLRLGGNGAIGSLKMRRTSYLASSWSKAELGRVQLNSRGDQRNERNRPLYSINESGIIRGEDFLTQAAPDSMAAMIYEQTLSTHPEAIDRTKSASELRREYRKKLEDRGMAMLILNRILDHEAMKRKLEPEVSDARVSYVLRSVLIQYGMNVEKLATLTRPLDETSLAGQVLEKDTCGRTEDTQLAESVASRTDAEMFAWLKSGAADEVVYTAIQTDLSRALPSLRESEIVNIVAQLKVARVADLVHGQPDSAILTWMDSPAYRDALDLAIRAELTRDRDYNDLTENELKSILVRTKTAEIPRSGQFLMSWEANAWINKKSGYRDMLKAAINADLKRAHTPISSLDIQRIRDRMTLTFEVDWSSGANLGLATELEAIHGGKDLGWPQNNKDRMEVDAGNCRIYRAGAEQTVKMVFRGAQFPNSVEEMRTAIRNQLQQTYRPYLRLATWRGLVMQAHPLATWEQMFGVTSDQMDRMYESLKGDLIKDYHNTGTLTEVRAQGSQADAFKARYLELLNQGETAHRAEFNPADDSGLETEEGRKQWMMKMAAIRHEIQTNAYTAATVEFADAIRAGRLTVSTLERKLERSASEPIVRGLLDEVFTGKLGEILFPVSFADQEVSSVLDIQFFTSRLVPRLAGMEGGKRHVIMTMTDLKVDPVYTPKSDPLVDQILTARVSARLQGRIFRRLAYDLFRLNPFKMTRDFCEDSNWPCSVAGDPAVGPRAMAEALFPETLYPGMALGNGSATTTLRDDALFDRVQEISISDLERVFMIPND